MRETDEEIYAKDKASYLPVFARYGIVLDHGAGVCVYDTKGRRYLDFLGGIERAGACLPHAGASDRGAGGTYDPLFESLLHASPGGRGGKADADQRLGKGVFR